MFGALLRAHLDSDGSLTAVNGYAAPGLDLSVDPGVSAARAGSTAVALVKADPPEHDGASDMSGLEAADTRLVVYRTGVTKDVAGKAVLAYVVEVTNRANVRDVVFIDAQTGKMVNRYSMIHNDLDRDHLRAEHRARPTRSGQKATLPGYAPSGPGQRGQRHRGVLLALQERVLTYESYDNPDFTMPTVKKDLTFSRPNANWNGVTTNYCDGVTSDDTVSHEWGHAYTEYTSGLVYQWQSGAMNEAYSDIWGETVDMINTRFNEHAWTPPGPLGRA